MLRSNLLSPSATSSFYSFLLKCNMNKIAKTSMGRVYKSCALKNVKFAKYVFNSAYRRKMTNEICATVPMGSNGIVDSARCLLHDYNNVNRSLLNMLLKTL